MSFQTFLGEGRGGLANDANLDQLGGFWMCVCVCYKHPPPTPKNIYFISNYFLCFLKPHEQGISAKIIYSHYCLFISSSLVAKYINRLDRKGPRNIIFLRSFIQLFMIAHLKRKHHFFFLYSYILMKIYFINQIIVMTRLNFYKSNGKPASVTTSDLGGEGSKLRLGGTT